MNKWTDNEQHTYYLYDETTGKILGSTHRIHSNILWHSKMFTDSPATEVYLGHYVSADFGKKAVEAYIEIQKRTLIEQK